MNRREEINLAGFLTGRTTLVSYEELSQVPGLKRLAKKLNFDLLNDQISRQLRPNSGGLSSNGAALVCLGYRIETSLG